MNEITMHGIDYKNIFCTRLKQARIKRGLSQRKLGILAGLDEFVASTRVNRYEKGVYEVDINTAKRLADALNVPLAYFYADDDFLAETIVNYKKYKFSNKKCYSLEELTNNL